MTRRRSFVIGTSEFLLQTELIRGTNIVRHDVFINTPREKHRSKARVTRVAHY